MVGRKLTRFRTDLGREPTPNERWRLERESVVDSRPSKPHGRTPAELRREWLLGEEDEFDKLEKRVHRLIEERRRARAREAERTAGRGLELDIN